MLKALTNQKVRKEMDASKLMAMMKDKKASMKKHERAQRPAPGKNRIVLLQGWRKEEPHVWFHEFGQHYIKNAANEIKAVYPCADATYGKPCAVCDGLAHAARMTKDDDTLNLLGEAKAGREILINALVLEGDKPNDPQVYAIKRGVFGQIIELIEEWGVQVFQRELVITREGKGLNTKYSVQISPKEVTVNPSVLEKLNNLDEYVAQESEEQLQRALGALNAVSGLLPAPARTPAAGGSADRPTTTESVLDASQDAGLREMEALATAPTVTSTVSVEEDLDALLGELS